jgi:hypothetical protein
MHENYIINKVIEMTVNMAIKENKKKISDEQRKELIRLTKLFVFQTITKEKYEKDS